MGLHQRRSLHTIDVLTIDYTRTYIGKTVGTYLFLFFCQM